MKNILAIISLLLLSLLGNAQDKVERLDFGGATSTYIDIPVTAEDSITDAQDTVDYIVKYTSPGYVHKVSVNVGAVKRTSNDTITVQLLGYEFYDDTTANVIISATTLNVTGTSKLIIFDDYQAGADEFSFRYYTIRIIRTGSGNGVRLNNLEFKVYN